jgi:hypothetical protein
MMITMMGVMMLLLTIVIAMLFLAVCRLIISTPLNTLGSTGICGYHVSVLPIFLSLRFITGPRAIRYYD